MTDWFAGERLRWTVAAAVATALTLMFVVLFRLPATPGPAGNHPAAEGSSFGANSRRAPKPVVQIARSTASDAVLTEELTLRDMRPLFLPTPGINAMLPEPRREPGRGLVDDQTPALGLATSTGSVVRDFPPPATLNHKPADRATSVDVVGPESGFSVQGIGRTLSAVATVRPRGGYVEVFAAATGHVAISEALPVEVLAPGDKPWEPMEFLATVDATGLSAPLVLTVSSRLEEVDAHYRNYLARRFRIGDRLPPGFYRIIVSP